MSKKIGLFSPLLTTIPGIKHCFFTKDIVGSTHNYKLSDNSFDNIPEIEHNLALISDEIGISPGNVALLEQIHSAEIVELDEVPALDNLPKADGYITRKPGLMLAVQTADCCPLLVAAPQAGLVAALHCGWRGVASGIIANFMEIVVDKKIKPEELIVALGPSIAASSYEVGGDLYEAFGWFSKRDHFFMANKNGKFQLDLPGVIRELLQEGGIRHIDHLAYDTYSNTNMFFSYRAFTQGKTKDVGRLISLIGIMA